MEDKDKGTFLIVNVAAQRARQLMQGAPSLVKTSSRKPAAIAIREVDEGLIPFYIPEEVPEDEEAAAEPQEVPPDE